MAIPLHVLILEDLPADALLMVHELRQAGFDPVWQRVETEADYVAHLQASLDVILADYRLPQFNALRALQLLQERGGDTPFLIVSATIGEDLAVAAMKQGAADYLLKDRLSRLGPAVARALQEVAERRARQQAEAALRASEARFRVMAEAAPVLLWMAGEDRGCTYFNQGWLAFTGRTMKQELGYGWADNVHPEDAERCLALYSMAFTARQPFEMEYRLRRADGVYRWVLNRGVPLETAAGHVAGYIGSAIDITERQQVEEMRQHLVAIIESSDAAIISQTLEGLITSWNRGAQRLYGYTAQEVLGKPVSILVPPNLTDEFPQILERLRRGEYIDHYETQRLRKDGTRLDVSLTLSPIHDASGRLIGASKIARDITERKRAEERFRLVVEAAPSALLMVDEHGVMTLVNSQTEQLFGYSRAELLGQPVEMLVPERFWAVHPRHREGFFQTPTTRAMGAGRDLFGLCKDGREVPIEIGLNPLRTEEGPLVLASIIDITERAQAAQRLMNSLREKEVLLREIHHRVKNNLAVIGSLLYLQSTTTQDEQTLRMLQNCRDRVYSMALVHERLYRSEDLASVNFAEYTEELTNQLFRNHVLSADTIRLKLEVEKSPLDIDRAIPCGLILTELISNALKHAFPNGRSGEIQVSLQRTKNGGLILSVADNGVGLPDEATLQTRRSLGMRLVHSLATQLDTQIEFLRRDPGTEVRWRLETSHV
jgi:PAS domain S-box-containing protein